MALHGGSRPWWMLVEPHTRQEERQAEGKEGSEFRQQVLQAGELLLVGVVTFCRTRETHEGACRVRRAGAARARWLQGYALDRSPSCSDARCWRFVCWASVPPDVLSTAIQQSAAGMMAARTQYGTTRGRKQLRIGVAAKRLECT